MPTNILNVPVYGDEIVAGNNEDLSRTYAYVDDEIVDVTVYNGGTAVGGAGFTGMLPAYFSSPISGVGRPAVGIATVSNGTLLGVALSDPGAGYGATERVGLTIPGADASVVVGIAVGNPIALDGIGIDVEVRTTPDEQPILFASSLGATPGLPISGALTTSQNLMTFAFAEAVMKLCPIGAAFVEARAYADGATRVILKGTFTVTQGIAFERG